MRQHHTYTPAVKDLAYTFGGVAPVASLHSGDVLTVFTEDCFGGAVTTIDDLPSRVCTFPYLNPLTGPFLVEGAEPGDTLAIHFRSIVPARAIGVSSTFPHAGALTSTTHTATLQPPLQERVWLYEIDTDAAVVRYRARNSDFVADLPLDAMHGTVGVAPPAFQARSSLTSDTHGGNMDTPELRAGTTVYLGVNVHGAMLSLGDGHARQGPGEVSGVAVEVAMTTTIALEVIKNVPTRWPRIESDDAVMSVGCARPLEDAFRISQHDLVTWTADLTGLDTLDAYQLVAQAGTALVGNVCDPNYTMLAALPKHLLPDPTTVYGGVHQRLRHVPVPAPVVG
ncbi:acetamidase/formamidase family protein [Mangrovihabitans endophyticus]|uniref:Amidase n=1 Tax=Mangrovihabitans endophyticus TaxID=1751298 RepID=A0A8J3C5J2_9ACTN|nr:acetamidase/formamidase family protein [Mangrovihabitans endophyticus]GGL20912.1 amidase [Mangrovihabitans endophyticus]